MRNMYLNSLLAIFLCFSGVASAKSAAKPSGVLVNGLQYEAGLASSAIAHKDICSIPFGTEDGNVGSHMQEQDKKRRTGGAPMAYRALPDGSFWVLDAINQKMKRFSAAGKLMSSFLFPGSSAKSFVLMSDLAVIPTGGFYLYNSSQGIVVRTDENGSSTVQIEGLPHSTGIGVDSKGNLLVKNAVMRCLLRFSPSGELIEKYDNKLHFLSTVVDASDKPLGIKFNDQEAELFRADNASPAAAVSIAKFPLQTPKERQAHYVSAELIGSDLQKNVYLRLIACDKNGVIHQYKILRLNSEGKTLSQADLLVIPFFAPRKMVATPDGKIFSFKNDKQSWIPITYTLP